MSRKIGIAAVGDVLDINCWSNTPYYFYTTGARAGLFTTPWKIDTRVFNLPRKLWNLQQMMLGRGKGGYQYSTNFLVRAENQVPHEYFSETVISFNQTFPRATSVLNRGGRIFYYIDATLHDLFGEKDYGLCVPPRMQAAAIDQERHNYALATAIVCMGSWVKQSLIDYYGVSPDKIYQILPGANMKLPHGWIPRGHVPGAGIVRPLVLGFIGKDWKRKGLQDLIEIKNFLREKGYKVLIKAVGNCPDALAREDGLEYTGFIDKQHDTDRFIDVISSCDIGCLLSKSEALGISTLEFLRVGVPVAGYYHQGLQDTLLEGAALRFSTGDSPRHIASIIENYIKDEALQRTMRAKAWEYSPAVTWERCVEKWSELVE